MGLWVGRVGRVGRVHGHVITREEVVANIGGELIIKQEGAGEGGEGGHGKGW